MKDLLLQAAQVLLMLATFIMFLLVVDVGLRFIQSFRRELRKRKRSSGSHVIMLKAIVILPVEAPISDDEIELSFEGIEHDLAHNLGWTIDEQFVDENTGDLVSMVSRPLTSHPNAHLDEVSKAGYTVDVAELFIK